MSRGVLYIATGRQFLEEARISARSVKEALDDVPITVVTDVEVTTDLFDSVVEVEDPAYSFGDQIEYMDRSPYERTLFLDTDTHVDEDCSELFDLLDRFDIGLAYSQSREAWPVEGVPESFPEYNSGVVVYRNDDTVARFLDRWRRIYEAGDGDRNQPSLRKALYQSDLRIATLTTEYNCMFRYPGHVDGPVKIFHGRLLDIDTPGAGEYFDAEDAIRTINSTTQPRVFTQLGGVSLHTNRTDSLVHRARLSYRKYGAKHLLKETGKLVIEKLPHRGG